MSIFSLLLDDAVLEAVLSAVVDEDLLARVDRSQGPNDGMLLPVDEMTFEICVRTVPIDASKVVEETHLGVQGR